MASITVQSTVVSSLFVPAYTLPSFGKNSHLISERTDSFFVKPERTMALIGRIAEGWVVVKPIVLTVEYGHDGAVVSDDLITMYGVGRTLSLAVNDYIQSLIEYYELLSERVSEDRANQRLFGFLSSFLRHDQSDDAHQNQTIKAAA